MHPTDAQDALARENADLRARLEVAEETLRAITANEVDGLVVQDGAQPVVFTLRGADESYRVLVESMRQGAATVAADGTILYCNRFFAGLLGTPLQQTIGSSVFDFVPPDQRGALRDLVAASLAAPHADRPFTVCPATNPDCGIAAILATTPLAVDGASCVCITVVDLTEHKARLTAEGANAAKDRFLALLSHELRTPLAPVLMTVASLETDPALPQQARDDLAMVRRNVELETKLIDDLLDLSRVSAGKLHLRVERVPLHQLVRDVVKLLKADLEQKSLTVTLDLAATADVVDGDAARLHQVLWNVLKNAIKFSHEHDPISIASAHTPDGGTRLTIRDRGVGIAPASLPKLFNAFEQGDQADGLRGGLGLGLAIAKSVVELHRGSISCTSDGVGHGCAVTIDLPPPASYAPTPASLPGPSVAPAQRLSILLVEDHAETAAILARLLRKHPHDVQTASSVAQAVQLHADHHFDLVISDIGLPDGTGYELMTQIRRTHPTPGIALSGYGMEDDLARSRQAGFFDHLVKPVSFAHLQRIIARVPLTR